MLAPLEDAVALVRVHAVPVLPELVIADLPRGTQVLVLTHDHAEDLALVNAALRATHLGPVGLIGSSAKWSRFRGQAHRRRASPPRWPIASRRRSASRE